MQRPDQNHGNNTLGANLGVSLFSGGCVGKQYLLTGHSVAKEPRTLSAVYRHEQKLGERGRVASDSTPLRTPSSLPHSIHFNAFISMN